MKIGITGTRYPITAYQRQRVMQFVIAHPISMWHHGLCTGADGTTHRIIREVGSGWIIGHPPVKDEHLDSELLLDCDELRSAKTHFARNRDVVNETDQLIVIPVQISWQNNGGTWYTHDYAVKKGKPVTIFWPEPKLEGTQLPI